MDDSIETINSLILDLSLAAAKPINAFGRNLLVATASANALGCRTETMEVRELRTFEWTVQPLLDLLNLEIDSALAAKASYGLRTLMASRICMSRFLELNGLITISKALDILLTKRVSELRIKNSYVRSTVEHLMVCYRETARFYQWQLVEVGGIRHCVIILRSGDVGLQTITATTLASLSTDLDICKQMFSYGAIKPLLNVSDATKTNDACMLAGLGCIIQLCRIPEIGVRMVHQGALPVLEDALFRQIGFNNRATREKALYALGYLSFIPELRSKLCNSPRVHKGIKKEFFEGTVPGKINILQLLTNLHNQYEGEIQLLQDLRAEVFNFLNTGPWHARNLCVRAVIVLYRTDEDRMWFVENGFIDSLIKIIDAKHKDLQEVPIVAMLYLCEHPDIPFILLEKDIVQFLTKMLSDIDPIIKDLVIVLLKTLLLYNRDYVFEILPKDYHKLLLKDPDYPELFGAEYGGLAMDYLQSIVQHRHDQDYLIKTLHPETIEHYSLTKDQLQQFQDTFMELDPACVGYLDEDALKLLMISLGEDFDREEIKLLLDEFDLEQSGNLNFEEFVTMMMDWETRLGKGLKRAINEKFKRGAIGKARRHFKKFREKNQVEAVEVQLAQEKRRNANKNDYALELQFNQHEQLRVKREEQIRLRNAGLLKSKNYDFTLPKIKKSTTGSEPSIW